MLVKMKDRNYPKLKGALGLSTTVSVSKTRNGSLHDKDTSWDSHRGDGYKGYYLVGDG